MNHSKWTNERTPLLTKYYCYGIVVCYNCDHILAISILMSAFKHMCECICVVVLLLLCCPFCWLQFWIIFPFFWSEFIKIYMQWLIISIKMTVLGECDVIRWALFSRYINESTERPTSSRLIFHSLNGINFNYFNNQPVNSHKNNDFINTKQKKNVLKKWIELKFHALYFELVGQIISPFLCE